MVAQADQPLTISLPDEDATLTLAGRFFRTLTPGSLIFLKGSLGAGKTTFVRGCLRAAGHLGAVKSPTFTLVEEYSIGGLSVYHFDLYRLTDPEELEWMGIRDYLRSDALCFVEWPERGEGFLPAPDLEVSIAIEDSARCLSVSAFSSRGWKSMEKLGV